MPINSLEDNDIPYGSWMFFDQLVIFDQMKRCITVVVYADTSNTSETHVEEIYQDSISRINRIRDLMSTPINERQTLNWDEKKDLNIAISSNWKRKEFEEAVVSAKEYIRKGDIFQIVISQKFQSKVKSDPFNPVSYTHLTLPTTPYV